MCFSSTSNSLNSSTTRLGGKTSRKPPWTWTCSWGGLMKSSFGWSQRCVSVLSSARGCSFSRSSSRLPPSKQTAFLLSVFFDSVCSFLFFFRTYLFMFSVKAVRSTGIWTPSLLSLWDWVTQQCAGWTRPGRWVPVRSQNYSYPNCKLTFRVICFHRNFPASSKSFTGNLKTWW